ncbi:MAG: AAA family ATPase [Candidatus Helarchaeota archaeon]
MKDKLKEILIDFDKKIVEREDENRMILLGLLAKEHILILGPPGTAKSLQARTVCNLIEGGNYFDYLLTRFTTPDEIFGPISVQKLEEDIYTRKTESFLPQAHVAFLDEIFKASSAILNTLLTTINERKFHNGNQVEDVPLISLIGASNEKPAEDEEESLEALYDRFSIRLVVDNVQNEDNFRKIIVENCGDLPINSTITLDEINQINTAATLVSVPDHILDILLLIKNRLKEENIIISDRRWRKIVWILRMSAATNERQELDESDILLLKFLLLDDEKQLQLITSILKYALTEGSIGASTIENHLNEIAEEKYELIASRDYDGKVIKRKNIKTIKESTPTVLKAISDLLQDDLEQIKQSFTALNDRRNKLEDNTKENIWVKWIDISNFLKPIDKEIHSLTQLKEEITEKLEDMNDPELKKISIQFKCPECQKKVIFSEEEVEKGSNYSVECQCESEYTVKVR